MERRATFKNIWLAYLLIAPQLLLVFVFFYWPTGEALYWAVTLEPPFGGGNQFVGWQNFQTVFADPTYWGSVRVSILFALFTTTLGVGFALVLALLVDRQLPGYRLFQFTYFWPYAIAAPAVGLAFRFIFAPDAGFMTGFFPWWNPARDGNHALALIVIANAWKMVGYNFIFFLAGLQSIPRSMIEAGAMDGSSALRRMWDIQIPLIMPTLFFLLVINLTESFVDSFGIVETITGGGPSRDTNLMVFKIYNDGFVGKDYSLASAQSIILMLLVIALTFIQFRFVERRIHYN